MVTTVNALLIFVFFAIPGMIVIWVIRRIQPGRELSGTEYLTRSLFTSLLIIAIPLALSQTLSGFVAAQLRSSAEEFAASQVRDAAICLIVLVPYAVVIGAMIGGLARWSRRFENILGHLGMLGLTDTWDRLFDSNAGWTLVRTNDCLYLGYVDRVDQSSTRNCALVLCRGRNKHGELQPITYTPIEYQTRIDEWPALQFHFVYIPRSEVRGIWAVDPTLELPN